MGFLSWVSVLVHSHRERLLAYARRRGLSAEDALDAVQDGFVSFLRLPEAQAIAHEGDDALKLLTVIVRHNLQKSTAERAVAAARGFGGLDLLVNNAGIFLAKPFTDYTAEDYAQLLSTNLAGFFHMTQQSLRHLPHARLLALSK